MPQRRFFQKYAFNGSRTHHIHLVKFNSDFWIHHLQFRDYLLLYPETVKEYEKLKIELSKNFSDTNLYAQAKTRFIKQIEQQATEYFKSKPKNSNHTVRHRKNKPHSQQSQLSPKFN